MAPSKSSAGSRKAAPGLAPRNSNRSVGVGIQLLKIIADLGRPGTLSEIASAAGLSASRTHRFLAGLIHAGAVRQEPASGRYDIGPLLVDLGVAALGRVDGIQLGTEALKEVTRRTGLVAVLAVWGPSGPIVIRWEQGELAAAIRIREGQTLPLLRTACGKLFLSYLPEERVHDLVEEELGSERHRESLSKVRDWDDVRRLQASVRRMGLASNMGEGNTGIAALAAPVFGVDHEITMAIAVISVMGVADLSFRGEAARQLREVTRELSRNLGATGTDPAMEPAAS